MLKTLLFAALIVVFHGHHVDAHGKEGYLTKCHFENDTCQMKAFANFASKYGPIGIKELGLSRMMPLDLKDVWVMALEYLKMKLVEGQCLGINTCRVLRYETDVKNFNRTIEVNCKKIVIKGRYEISTHPFFANHNISYDVSGYGNGSLVLDDWYFLIKYPFEFVRREDGHIYFYPKFHEGSYVSEVLTKVTVSADLILFNRSWNVTRRVLGFINYYWRIIFKYFFRSFHYLSMEYYYKVYIQFFRKVPAKEYLSNNLTPYLTRNRLCRY